MLINVVLTSTEYVDPLGDDYKRIKLWDLPLCLTSYCLSINDDKEITEHLFAQESLKMATSVKINSSKQTVRIGEDNDYLVDFKNDKDSKYSKDFFLRWEKSNSLLFEFVTWSFENKVLFVLQGLWRDKSWSFLEIITKPLFLAWDKREN